MSEETQQKLKDESSFPPDDPFETMETTAHSAKSDSESDTESFTDALEQLDLQHENPVTFDKSVEKLTTVDSSLSSAGPGGDTATEHKSSKLSLSEGTPSSCDKDLSNEADTHSFSSAAEEQTMEDFIKKATDDSTAAAGTDQTHSDSDTEADVIDEDVLREREALMSEEEKEEKKEESNSIKLEGNDRFNACNYQGAIESYTEALMLCPLCFAKERSIMYSNRGACKLKLERNDAAIEDCTKALELHPVYLKALLRRAELYEKTDKLEDALSDYQRALELDATLAHARQACMILPGKIEERNEKMKQEMMGKLKDLGNMVLRPFGLSTENFNLQQDPSTGSYSVQFQQGPPPPPENGL